MRIGLLLAAAVALATAASLEGVPTDSRLYDDFDLLKTSGLIHSMPATSKPWTRGECVQLVQEALASAEVARPAPAQRAALKRLEYEFGSELPALPARRPAISIPIPDLGDAQARCDLFSRATATRDQQRLSLGAVLNNRGSRDFAFYERFELTAYRPEILEETLPSDSSGRHAPGMRGLVWRNLATLETDPAYLAFRLPMAVRLELGRDRFVWGPGCTGSVMLDDTAPGLDHVQLCASYRNFKFLSFTSYLSRWNTKPRFLSAQRLEVSLFNRVTLGGAMMAVASWDELQPTQLGGLINPLIPIYLTVSNDGHGENLLVGLDAVVYLPRTKVYGQFFMDNYEFNELLNAPNAVGLQGGAYWAPNLPVEARLEYTRITAFTYYHRIHSLMYENFLATMGHPLGPDADQLFATVNVTPNGWFKVNVGADYTRRGFHNRGDYLRKSFKVPQDQLYLRQHNEFPTRGWDTLSGVAIEEVDKTLRFAPGVEIRALRDLFVSLSIGLWHSQNYQGTIGLDKNGVDLAFKVEYRY
ncbi:MAG: hypothetical protein NTX53_19770 [candidate division WOR-3 bacterium]|nr:hypothetical protein [candidate division WOR-3 bacterium]